VTAALMFDRFARCLRAFNNAEGCALKNGPAWAAAQRYDQKAREHLILLEYRVKVNPGIGEHRDMPLLAEINGRVRST
jgi:hypothetical protein